MTSSFHQVRDAPARHPSFGLRVFSGGGYPRRSALAVASALCGLAGLVVLLMAFFGVPGSRQLTAGSALLALAGFVCGVLALFRDWGRARLGVVLLLCADLLMALIAAMTLGGAVPTGPTVAVVLVLLVLLCLGGAVLVFTAPRKGDSSTPRAVEPHWPHGVVPQSSEATGGHPAEDEDR